MEGVYAYGRIYLTMVVWGEYFSWIDAFLVSLIFIWVLGFYTHGRIYLTMVVWGLGFYT
jgi:hypothetical protein